MVENLAPNKRLYRMSMAVTNSARLAVLIDADNAQPSIAEALLAEVAKYGTAHVKRAYGDWTGTELLGWKKTLLAQSIQPIQQFAYTTGKNATDVALVIDAMDLLYTGCFEGFCIVSSDSDFTRLAQRLRESGLTVYGFGEHKTPKAFVTACDKFIYTENLRFTGTVAAAVAAVVDDSGGDIAGAGLAALGNTSPARKSGYPPAKPPAGRNLTNDPALVDLLRSAVEGCSDEDGWAPLAAVGGIITKRRPDFDSRNYGYFKLIEVVKATALYHIERRCPGEGKPALPYICEKRPQKHQRLSY